MSQSKFVKLIHCSTACFFRTNVQCLTKQSCFKSIRCFSNGVANNSNVVKLDFSSGFFKFNVNDNQFIVSFWTPLRSLLQAMDDRPEATINKGPVIDQQNKVALASTTPIGFVFSNINSLSFEHPTLGPMEVDFSGSPEDLVKWKEKFESELQYGLEGMKKPETVEQQEISFLEHEKNNIKLNLTPLIQDYRRIVSLARTDANRKFKWGGLFLLSAQLGFVARLTWFEYSWDIMEPITWMLTYAMMVGTFAYYIVTSQEYLVPSVERRLTIRKFWKLAQKHDFDVNKYYQLRSQLKLIDEKIMKIRTMSI